MILVRIIPRVAADGLGRHAVRPHAHQATVAEHTGVVDVGADVVTRQERCEEQIDRYIEKHCAFGRSGVAANVRE